jgi:hypothetical protein
MRLRLTDRVRIIVDATGQTMRDSGSTAMGTADVLREMVRAEPAYMGALGVTGILDAPTGTVISSDPVCGDKGKVPSTALSHNLRAVLNVAVQRTVAAGNSFVDLEHMLLAITEIEGCSGATLLTDSGLDLETVQNVARQRVYDRDARELLRSRNSAADFSWSAPELADLQRSKGRIATELRVMYVFFAMIIVLGVARLVHGHVETRQIVLYLVIQVLVLALFAMMLRRIIPALHWRRIKSKNKEVHLSFTDRGIWKEVDGAPPTKAGWDMYHRAVSWHDTYLLYGAERYPRMSIPKRAFSTKEDELAFRQLVARYVGEIKTR